MRVFAEHRWISVITLLYTGFVVYGFLGTKTFLTFRGKVEMPTPAFSEVYVSFGLFLLLLPFTWLISLAILDRKEIDW